MFVNLTQHAITLVGPQGGKFTVPPSGTVARIDSTPGELTVVLGSKEFPEGVQLVGPTTFGAPVGLPEPQEGVTYIVSALFAGRVGDRNDVYYPGTGPKDGAIRNDKGQVEAVTRLIRA